MVIQAPATAVMPALDRILAAAGLVRVGAGGRARSRKKNVRVLRYAAGEVDGWSILAATDERFMPGVALELARALEADVLGLDAYERYSYEHASHVHAETPRFVFTMNGAEVLERYPRDVGPLLREGVRRTTRRLPPGLREGVESGRIEEHERALFDLYWESLAPTDARARVDEILDACPYEVEYEGDPAALGIDLFQGALWSARTGVSLDRIPKAATTARSSTTAKPAKSAKSAKPAKPTKPAKAAKPAKPRRP